MPVEHLLVYFIAIWRISNLFVHEAGPWNVFRRIRELAGIQHDEMGNIFMVPDRFFSLLFSCVWCFSVWVSFFATIIWLFFPEISLVIFVPFAFSGGACLIEAIRTKQGRM